MGNLWNNKSFGKRKQQKVKKRTLIQKLLRVSKNIKNIETKTLLSHFSLYFYTLQFLKGKTLWLKQIQCIEVEWTFLPWQEGVKEVIPLGK